MNTHSKTENLNLRNGDTMSNTFKTNGGWGELVCDCDTGNVVRYDRGGDWKKEGDGYDIITRLDVDEWRNHYPGESITAGHHIFDFGLWVKSGQYVEPEHDWRIEAKAQAAWRDGQKGFENGTI
jgi:hypothetical protein